MCLMCRCVSGAAGSSSAACRWSATASRSLRWPTGESIHRIAATKFGNVWSVTLKSVCSSPHKQDAQLCPARSVSHTQLVLQINTWKCAANFLMLASLHCRGLGQYWGRVVSQNAYGHILGHVKARS